MMRITDSNENVRQCNQEIMAKQEDFVNYEIIVIMMLIIIIILHTLLLLLLL